MAELLSVQSEIRLSFRLLGKASDPFEKSLEWFDYELAVEGGKIAGAFGREASPADRPPEAERRSAHGKISSKDLDDFLHGLDELIEYSRALRFEPYDLNFYFEWSHETPLVYLIVTWFDLALSPRRFDRRFPSCHAGFRFLADAESLGRFRRAVGEEFTGAARPAQAADRKSSTLIN